MPKLKLTKDAIRRLPAPDPSGKQVLHWDSDQRGFGVLCSGKTNTKSYVVQREINRRTRRVTLGTVAEFEAARRSVEDARQEAAEMVLSMRKGIDPKARPEPTNTKANRTLQQILETYLANQPLAANSRKLYRHHIEKQLSDWLDRPLREITPEMVVNRFRKIKKDATGTTRANTSSEPGAATANSTMRALRTLWYYAKGDGVPDLPADNPVKQLTKRWYSVPPRETFVSGDKLPAFYRAVCKIENMIIRDYILLVLFTGLRRDEAASLRWADVDFSQRFIRIPSWRTKAKRPLDLPMPDYVHSLLVARRAIGIENEYVFPANSRSRHLENPKEALQAACESCGIRVSVHDLRRTFVTAAARCSIPPMALSGLVNHSAGKSITTDYAQLHGSDLVEPMQIVCDRLKELCQVASFPPGSYRCRHATGTPLYDSCGVAAIEPKPRGAATICTPPPTISRA